MTTHVGSTGAECVEEAPGRRDESISGSSALSVAPADSGSEGFPEGDSRPLSVSDIVGASAMQLFVVAQTRPHLQSLELQMSPLCFDLVQTTTLCITNKHISRVLLQNQTFVSTLSDLYNGSTDVTFTRATFLTFSSVSGGSRARVDVVRRWHIDEPLMHTFCCSKRTSMWLVLQQDFHIVPHLCSEEQLVEVFDSVNSCEEYVVHLDTLTVQ